METLCLYRLAMQMRLPSSCLESAVACALRFAKARLMLPGCARCRRLKISSMACSTHSRLASFRFGRGLTGCWANKVSDVNLPRFRRTRA